MTKKAKQQYNLESEKGVQDTFSLSRGQKFALAMLIGTGVVILMGAAFVFYSLMSGLEQSNVSITKSNTHAPIEFETPVEGDIIDVDIIDGKDMSFVVYDKNSGQYHLYYYSHGSKKPLRLYTLIKK